MSFVHRLIVGHFDIGTFVWRPVPLRSLDVRRTRAMLEEVGEPVSEGEYAVDGEPLYFVDGYCDCPWLSAKHNEKSESFARSVARIEDCYLIEKGTRNVLHPIRFAEEVPVGARSRDERQLLPLSRTEAEVCIRRNDPEVLCRAVLEAAAGEGDWVEGFCARLAGHDDFHVRGNALFALGRLATRETPLNREVIQPIIEKAMTDPVLYVSGHATIAAEAVELHLKWVISLFDNGNPEMELSEDSNGWVKCPNCRLRFTTHGGGFREGRCMNCRQRVRVIKKDT